MQLQTWCSTFVFFLNSVMVASWGRIVEISLQHMPRSSGQKVLNQEWGRGVLGSWNYTKTYNVLWWLFCSSCRITDVAECYFFHLGILYIKLLGKYDIIGILSWHLWVPWIVLLPAGTSTYAKKQERETESNKGLQIPFLIAFIDVLNRHLHLTHTENASVMSVKWTWISGLEKEFGPLTLTVLLILM